MAETEPGTWTPRVTAARVLSLVGATLTWTVAAAAGLIIAATVTVALVLAGLVGAVVVGMARILPKTQRAPADDPVIEAHHVGGHSWVAYGFDRRS